MEVRKPVEIYYALKANEQVFEVLEASKTLTDRIFDELPIVLAMIDDRQRLLKLNQAGQQLFVQEEKLALGGPIEAFLPEGTTAGIRRYFAAQADGQTANETFEDTILVNGARRYFQWRIKRAFDVRGSRRSVHVLIGTDLTEARVALETLVDVRRDLEVARTVQSMLVSNTDVVFGRYFKMIGHYEPAQQVGGDLWWHREIPGLGTLVVVADVTGHGVGSAMVAAAVIGALSSSITRLPPASPAELETMFAEIGQLILQTFNGKYFVCFAGILICESEPKAFVIGAGFPSVLVFGKGKAPFSVSAAGNPLGIPSMNEFKVRELPFAPGDRLVCFSDGCYETIGSPGPMQQRTFKQVLARHRELELTIARSHIAADLQGMRNKKLPDDDVTFVMIDRT